MLYFEGCFLLGLYKFWIIFGFCWLNVCLICLLIFFFVRFFVVLLLVVKDLYIFFVCIGFNEDISCVLLIKVWCLVFVW